MPATRRLPAVLVVAALLLSACARGRADDSNASPAPATTVAPATTTQATGTSGQPEGSTSTTGPPGQTSAGRCPASALRGSDQGREGAAGTIWITVGLRNVSATTCTVKGSPAVQLLDAQGQPLFAPVPARPGGALVALRPGAAAQLAVGISNVCDRRVDGAGIRVTPTPGKGSLVVRAGFATCRSPQVLPLEHAAG
jgi:Protein of unknown function (DUF4232)